MGKIRDRMEADLRLRNLSPSTQSAYLRCVHRFVAYHMRSPAEMGAKEVRDFLVHLRDERKLTPSSIKVYVAALNFLYTNTLQRPEVVQAWFHPRIPKRLPDVMSPEEVETLLNSVESIKHRTMLATAYGAGLRISEVCRLQIEDIDSGRMLLHIRDGKGGRDRYALLSPRLLHLLRAYFRAKRPPGPYLFPGWKDDGHISSEAVRKVQRKVARECGIPKGATPHVLRHSFATQLLDAGTDIRIIQVLLGHKSIRTTQLYTQVSPEQIQQITSPLDTLDVKEKPPRRKTKNSKK